MICAEREVQRQKEEGYYEPNPYEDDQWDDEDDWDDEEDEFESQLELDEKFDLDPVLKQHVYELDLPSLIILSKMTDELITEKIELTFNPLDQDLGDIPF